MKRWVILLALLMPNLALAGAMTVDADRFELMQAQQRADFFGHVIIKRDDMTLKGDKVRVWYEEEKQTGKKVLKKAEATGHVLIDTDDSKGASDYALFTTDSDMLIMKGNATMTSKQGTVSGEHIAYNVVTKDTKVMGSKASGQVHFTFDEKAQ
jgi:lipopolysaccharide transport protein LptA